MRQTINSLMRSLVDAVYPPLCEVCGRPLLDCESEMCLQCDAELPRTNIHAVNASDIHDRVTLAHVPFERLAVYMHYYRESPYAALIRRGKYQNRPWLISFLTRKFVKELPADFFNDIDVLLPVGMAWFKRMKRGYNQAEEICKTISAMTGIPIGDNLRMRRHKTQARQSASSRGLNASGNSYVTDAGELDGLHLLIVDDIITTGSTMTDAMTALHHAAPTARISILALAATHRH